MKITRNNINHNSVILTYAVMDILMIITCIFFLSVGVVWNEQTHVPIGLSPYSFFNNDNPPIATLSLTSFPELFLPMTGVLIVMWLFARFFVNRAYRFLADITSLLIILFSIITLTAFSDSANYSISPTKIQLHFTSIDDIKYLPIFFIISAMIFSLMVDLVITKFTLIQIFASEKKSDTVS